MKTATATVMLLAMLSVGAFAENKGLRLETFDRAIVCMSLQYFKELMQAGHAKDMPALDWLFRGACLQLRGGLPVTILDSGRAAGFPFIKVRVSARHRYDAAQG